VLIKWITSTGVYDLCDGSDRSVGKRCGPDGFAAPLTILADDTPCVDAAWQQPQERGNRTNRITFSVSIELASIGAALAMVSQVKRIPSAGVLLTIDEDSGEMVRYENATLRSIDPRQQGVSLEILYAFVSGEDIDMGTAPQSVSGVTGTADILRVTLTWNPSVGAASYQVWFRIAGTTDEPQLLQDEITETTWTHVSGDTTSRTYWLVAISMLGESSEMTGGVNVAGKGY